VSGGELGQSVGAVSAPTFRQTRAAAVHVADRIAAEHPHELDELMPKPPPATSPTPTPPATSTAPDWRTTVPDTDTKPKPADIADVIEKAAEIVEKNGLHKGYLYDEAQADEGTKPAECPVDVVGAINIAVFGKPSWPSEERPGSRLAQAAVLALGETVGKPVPGWNDEDERVVDDVVTNLWEAAERLRKEAS
jgi:hypothetical protein